LAGAWYLLSFLAIAFIMSIEFQIPEPILFNPLKHHFGFISEFIKQKTEGESDPDNKTLIRELKHLGTSVMDVYTGSLLIIDICREVLVFLENKKLSEKESYATWAGKSMNDFRLLSLSDGSQWALKYNTGGKRFVHLFPSRESRHTFRVKSNTLKSALLYLILVGKDYITRDDLNKVRPLLGLSPIKDPIDAGAITEMIEILRGIP
jgi:hypothetical protein